MQEVTPWGTDNAVYRLGDDKVVRLPRTPRTSRTLEMERYWLTRLGPRLPLATPVPWRRESRPAAIRSRGPCIAGSPESPQRRIGSTDPIQLAIDLARFISALQRIDTSGGPPPGEVNVFRGEPLARRGSATRAAIASLRAELDAAVLRAEWDEALATPEWEGPPVWLHGDLDSRNLLAHHGRLSAVIDFGTLSVGDPACDVMAAWKLLSADGRRAFRSALAVDEAT